MRSKIKLRAIEQEDCEVISQAFKKQGWDKPVSQYQNYYDSQSRGERDVILASYEDDFAGYLVINWKSTYLPFFKEGIPEIVDFNVLKKYQRRGIGSMLMDEAERQIAKVSSRAGIGVGLYEDYGAAQALYAERGYVPDGRGITRDSKPVLKGQHVTMDDGLIMCLVKQL